MIRSTWGQMVTGVFLAALGTAFTVWSWHTALHEGYYYRKAAAIFPAVAVCGLGMVLFPIDYDELERVHGVKRIHTFQHLPATWKVIFVLALAIGLGNWYAIANL